MEKFLELLNACWIVLGQMSPYLILGFLISGLLSVMISPRWVEKHLGTGRVGPVIKATLLGVPLPLCSCGVIPVAASLRRHGAGKGATTAFLISTPQTGADSILATWGLLGPFFAIFRPLVALLTGIVGGMAVSLTDKSEAEPRAEANNSVNVSQPQSSLAAKIVSALKYAFVTLPGEIARALFVGVIIAGLISTFVSGEFVGQFIGNYYLTMLLMLAIGIPVYVCSTSSIPIALAFIKMGVSPGAAFVFLISGPATNAAAISVIWKILGRSSALIYLTTIFAGSLAGGLALDYLDQNFSEAGLRAVTMACHTELSLIETGSAILMLIILCTSYYLTHKGSQGCSTCASCETRPAADLTLHIDGMSCNNCAMAVRQAVLEMPGVSAAEIILAEKKALIIGHAVNHESIIAAINSLGYSARVDD
ncbi:MAG: SO_0444 family Cu/Zn efflux transporter [Candidatus Riflebacteria bacterium]|nr:SO_0444 family Cu/Zn efflux transporter [Candidatus Riflebacteria bacterium]